MITPDTMTAPPRKTRLFLPGKGQPLPPKTDRERAAEALGSDKQRLITLEAARTLLARLGELDRTLEQIDRALEGRAPLTTRIRHRLEKIRANQILSELQAVLSDELPAATKQAWEALG